MGQPQRAALRPLRLPRAAPAHAAHHREGRPASLNDVSAWCRRQLGSAIDEELWVTGHLSTVLAVRLADGREVVLKIRPNDPALAGCHGVHVHLWEQRFPCPEPLTPALPYGTGDLVISAEAHLPGGEPGHGDDPTLAERSARELRRLIAMTPAPADIPSLDPPRPWAGWADPRADPWPPPDEGVPLNHHSATEPFRALAHSLNERLRDSTAPRFVGHVDWYQGNLRWNGDGTLRAADDWDSISALSEAALAGCAAVSFKPAVAGRHPPTWPGAEVEDTEEFLERYGLADDLEIAYAAGLWQRVFDAAKFSAAGARDAAASQLRDAPERARRAGLRWPGN